jgi:hypothetical protein
MAAIKGIEDSSQKWTRRAQVAGEDYRQGVANPRTPWDQASIAADSSYRQAVTQAAAAGRYASGVRKAGAEKWRTNATAKGPQRFAEGVQLSEGEWQRGFQPYQAAIGSLTLPPRGPVGSPQNLQRVTAVANALRQVRERTGK